MCKTPNARQQSLDLVAEYQKLCLKSFIQSNPSLISVLKNENLNLNPEYSMKEILIINKLIGKHLIYKKIHVETNESLKGMSFNFEYFKFIF
jgi:hypothetical protein